MQQPSLLDLTEWRAFRLFLADLDDGDLVGIGRQLRREVAARQERETHFTRLFFSSLQAADLQTAQQAIRAERRARTQDRQILRRLAARDKNASDGASPQSDFRGRK